MAFSNFRKETSERSDASNWAKQRLLLNTHYYFDSIEGCNENNKNVVTHMMERARVDYDGVSEINEESILFEIKRLENIDVLQRKINFAKAFNLPLSYVLYCDEVEKVWFFEFDDINTFKFVLEYNSYIDFSNWIASIKGWKSSKPYREKADLPYFDKKLRQIGTAWPTNIDCFVSDEYNRPIGILEFQNAKNTHVKDHCNNEFFLCKQEYIDPYTGYVKYHDDIRRWMSQEILRVQSGLRLFVITWAQETTDFVLKEIESITFPYLPYSQDWKLHKDYKKAMHNYAVTRNLQWGNYIRQNFISYSLSYSSPQMILIYHKPPLSAKDKTFPFIYYKYKWLKLGQTEQLEKLFLQLIKEEFYD